MIPSDPGDLALLLNGPGDQTVRFYLEKYGFVWSELTALADVQSSGVNGDTAIFASFSGTEITWWTRTDAGVVDGGTKDVGYTVDGISVTDNETTIYFWSGQDVYVYDYDSDTLSAFVGLSGAVNAIGSVQGGVIHALVDVGGGVSRFVRYAGFIEQSELYWTFPVDSFSCRQTAGGEEILIVSNGYTPYRAARAQGVQVAWETRQRTGAVAFVYRANVWSDHYDIAIAEDYLNQEARLATSFLCGFGVGAVFSYSSHQHEGAFFSISENGSYWELPTPLSKAGENPVHMVVTPLNVYLYVDGTVWNSPVNFRFGYHSERVLDITDLVNDAVFNLRVKAGVTLSSVSLTDELEAFVDDPEELILIVQAGYQYGDTIIRPQLFIGPVATASMPESADGSHTLQIKANDMLSLMGRQTVFDQLHDGIDHGYDPFTDVNETGTEYGGLAHTGAQKGSWKTPRSEEGEYTLQPSSGGRSVAFTTFTPHALNGTIRAWCSTDDGANESFGLCGRGSAPYLLTEAILAPADELLTLRYWHGEKDTDSEDGDWKYTDILSVALAGTEMWMEYYFRYGLHRVFTSADGISWIKVLETVSPVGVFPGSMGYVAETPEETDWNPGDTPGWDPDPWDPVDPVEETGIENPILALSRTFNNNGDPDHRKAFIHITEEPHLDDPTWVDVTRNLNTDFFTSDLEVFDLEFAQGGEYPTALYASVYDATTGWHIVYLQDPLDDGTSQWAEVEIPEGYRVYAGRWTSYQSQWPVMHANPGADGRILMEVYEVSDTSYAWQYAIFILDGAVVFGPTFTGHGTSTTRGVRSLNWYDQDYIIGFVEWWSPSYRTFVKLDSTVHQDKPASWGDLGTFKNTYAFCGWKYVGGAYYSPGWTNNASMPLAIPGYGFARVGHIESYAGTTTECAETVEYTGTFDARESWGTRCVAQNFNVDNIPGEAVSLDDNSVRLVHYTGDGFASDTQLSHPSGALGMAGLNSPYTVVNYPSMIFVHFPEDTGDNISGTVARYQFGVGWVDIRGNLTFWKEQTAHVARSLAVFWNTSGGGQ